MMSHASSKLMDPRETVSVQDHKDGLPRGRLDSVCREGVLFMTYSLLVQNLKSAKDDTVTTALEVKQLDKSIPQGSRLEQVVEWLKGEAEPLVIFDECHKAKNLIAKGGGTLLKRFLITVEMLAEITH